MKRLLIMWVVLALSSCASQGRDKDELFSYKDSLTAFSKYIPKGNAEYLATRGRGKMLGLDSLENGFTNLQIRVWYDFSRANKGKLIQILNSGKTWTAKVFNFTVDRNKIEQELLYNDTISLFPKAGWKPFFDKLVALKIFTLPDMSTISTLEDNWKDGHSYHFEIASRNQYRFYSYHMPEEFTQFWQARNVTAIIDLFSTELTVDR